MNVYINDDYAGLDIENISFYYGYEIIYCPKCDKIVDDAYCKEHEDEEYEWCFEAKINDIKYTYSFSDLGQQNMHRTEECLIAGIGRVLMEIIND